MKQPILLPCIICLALFTKAQAPKLVGMTSEGGVYNGAGTIVQYTGGSSNIALTDVLTAGNPVNTTLVEAPNGKLYGITDDGYSGTDVLIEYDYTTNAYTTIATFDDSTGAYPACSLLLVGDSTFYGSAYKGGANGSGTLFSYTIGADTVVRLVDLPPGAYPIGSLMRASDGNLYGMTQLDGAHNSGTLYSYNIASNTYTPLYSMPSYSHTYGSLLEVGTDTLYGMTTNDSVHVPNTGYIFSYVIGTNYITQLYFFPGTHTYAEGSLIRAADGLLYGMTSSGGTYSTGLYSGGMLFNFNPGTGVFDTLHNFGNGTDGAGPIGDLYQASDGMLYGFTNSGGTHGPITASGIGTIFQYNIGTHTYTQELSLDTSTGYFPGWGHLTEYQPLAVTGITNMKGYQFSLYPNPTSGLFTIEYNYADKLSVQILNLLGEKLQELTATGARSQFDISELPAGIYEVQFSDGTQMLKTLKVVKE